MVLMPLWLYAAAVTLSMILAWQGGIASIVGTLIVIAYSFLYWTIWTFDLVTKESDATRRHKS